MAFDAKEKIEEIVGKIKNDPSMMDKFKENPEKTLEDLTGIDIPDGQVDAIVNGVKAKLTADKVKDVASSLTGMLKK